MPDEIRVNRQPSSQGGQPAARPDMTMQGDTMMAPKNSKAPWIILAVVVVVIVLLGVLFRTQLFKGSSGGTMTGPAAGTLSGYQAVFLTNGQVYFGKMSDQSDSYATLKDIYYLQVTNPPPPLQGAGTQAPQQPTISLVKLGQELHGPVDEMHISRAQILFYEDLKTEGSVVTAIMKDKATKAAAPAPAPAPAK